MLRHTVVLLSADPTVISAVEQSVDQMTRVFVLAVGGLLAEVQDPITT